MKRKPLDPVLQPEIDYCSTVATLADHQTMQDDTVTLRDRDSTEQVRIPIAKLVPEIIERIGWHR